MAFAPRKKQTRNSFLNLLIYWSNPPSLSLFHAVSFSNFNWFFLCAFSCCTTMRAVIVWKTVSRNVCAKLNNAEIKQQPITTHELSLSRSKQEREEWRFPLFAYYFFHLVATHKLLSRLVKHSIFIDNRAVLNSKLLVRFCSDCHL